VSPSVVEDPALVATGSESAPRLPRVVVAAEVCLYREGLAHSLERRGAAEVAATASSRAEAVDRVLECRPDVVLLDMGLVGACEVVRALRDALPPVKVLALAIAETEEMVVACAEAGVAGYVPRDASMDDLVRTLHAVARGEMEIPSHIAASLFRRVGTLASRREPPPAPVQGLTPREREIVALIDRGCSNKEIARRLDIELSTVKNHVHNLLEKLGVQRRSAAAARVREAVG
jgi:two-component system nitrate/nitrite response regulator NarL